MTKRKDWLQTELEDWRDWVLTQLDHGGYASVTLLHKLMSGDIGERNFKSTIPSGIEPTKHYLRHIDRSMADLLADPRKVKYITAMRIYYLLGPKRVKKELTKDYSTFYRWRKKGENQLRAYMQGENESGQSA